MKQHERLCSADMPEPIIRVENLGKKYLIRHQAGGPRYRALRDVLANGLKTGFGLFGGKNSLPSREEFWALKDVNFEVNEGEVVGIIGRNGAGKSTLLKILSRITEPTTGRVTLNGRVASLLEVGTGFHPELTGRENIYLNGSILGMSRAEITRKFDEIVAFAEVEKFLDTPVKRYSSGMYVRLAFAVAAHLEPEILVVDEVLAVGDAEFQKKCLGKMGEVARGGRTVLFVSHQLGMVETLCRSAILLRRGQVVTRGETGAVIRQYLGDMTSPPSEEELTGTARSGTQEVVITRCWVEDEQGRVNGSVASGRSATVALEYRATVGPTSRVSFGVSFHTPNEVTVSLVYSDYQGVLFTNLPATGVVRFTLPRLPFSHGSYSVGARVLVNGTEADWPRGYLARLDVDAGDFYKAGQPFHSGIGPVLVEGEWSVGPTAREGVPCSHAG